MAAGLVRLAEGRIVAYHDGRMEAVCGHDDHSSVRRCVLTRSYRTGSSTGPAPAGPSGGRVLGFLAAWLKRGAPLRTREEHWAPAMFKIEHEERLLARTEVMLHEGAEVLLALEPDECPGHGPEPPRSV